MCIFPMDDNLYKTGIGSWYHFIETCSTIIYENIKTTMKSIGFYLSLLHSHTFQFFSSNKNSNYKYSSTIV